MNADTVNNIATVLALSGALPAWLGFLTFVLGRPRTWWRSWLGWTLALLLFSIAFIFAFILVRRIAGAFPAIEWVALFLYALLTLALWLVFVMIVLERRRGRGLGFFPIATPRQKGKTMSPIDPNAPSVPAGNGTIVTLDQAGRTVTADATTGEPTAKPTGKVLATAVSGAALVVVVAMLAAVTPDLLTFAGPWSVVLYAGIVALGGFLAGYLKRP